MVCLHYDYDTRHSDSATAYNILYGYIPFEGEYIVDGWWNLEALGAFQANVRTKGQIISHAQLQKQLD